MDRRAFDSFGSRLAALDLEPDDSVCIPVPKRFIRFLIGAIMPLRWHDLWEGDPQAVNLTTAQVDDFIASLVIGDICPGCPDCPPTSGGLVVSLETCNAAGFGGGVIIEMEDEMGDVVTEVKILNGKLRVYHGHCCFDEYDLSGIVQDAANDEIGDEPLIPPSGTPPTYSACGKALAVVATIFKIVEGAYNALDEFPWDYVSSVENYVGYDLDNSYLLLLIADWVSEFASLGLSYSDIYDPVEKQEIVCQISDLLPDDGTGVTEEQFSEIHDIFFSVMMPNLLKWGFFETAMRALGWKDANTIAKLGAVKTDGDCACPGEQIALFPGFGTGQDWIKIFDFRQPLPADALLEGDNPRWTQGIGVWAKPAGTDDKTTMSVTIPLTFNTGAAAITQMALAFQTRGDENWDDAIPYPVNVDGGGAQNMPLSAVTAVCSEDPSAAGVWQVTKACYVAIGAGEPDNFQSVIATYHPPDTNPPDEVAYSTVLIGMAFAGIGDDPRP